MNASDVTAEQVKALFAGYNNNNQKCVASFIDLIFNLNNQPIVDKTDSYTLAITEKNALVRMNKATANALTVPPASAVAFPIGTRIDVEQVGAGTTTLTAGAGVTIQSNPGPALNGQYAVATLTKVATNTWVASGNLV